MAAFGNTASHSTWPQQERCREVLQRDNGFGVATESMVGFASAAPKTSSTDLALTLRRILLPSAVSLMELDGWITA